MAMFRSRVGRAMVRSKKRPTGQKVPRKIIKKLPRGIYVRGGLNLNPGVAGGSLKPGIKPSVMPSLTGAKIADLAVGKALPTAPAHVQRAASSTLQAVAGALTVSAAKKAQSAMATRVGGGGSKKPPLPPGEFHANDPVLSAAGMSVGVAPRNNALVPDKKLTLSVTNGFYTAREKKFYSRWPVQTLQLYQSRIHNRMRHIVAPGHKSFWYPFENTISAPPIASIHSWRKGVEMSVNAEGTVSQPPGFLPSNLNYGTTVGGQDFTYPLHLGGYADYCSILSALTDDSFPNRAGRALQSNASLKFGTVSNHLTFDIENQNKFFPADFTIQVHEVIDAGNLDNYTVRDPISVMFNATGGIPDYARGFLTNDTVAIPGGGGDSAVYTNTKSILANAPTIANLTLFKRIFRTLGSHKVSLTAGSRLSVEMTNHCGAFDLFDYMSNPSANQTNAVSKQGQLFITIMVKGNKECSGNVYSDGVFQHPADYQSNPCAYSVMNINKFAKVHAPQLIVKTDDTTGYENANEQYVKFTTEMFAFGEQRQSSFVPVGEYTHNYDQVTDDPTGTTGTTVVFPVLTNQTTSAAGQR